MFDIQKNYKDCMQNSEEIVIWYKPNSLWKELGLFLREFILVLYVVRIIDEVNR